MEEKETKAKKGTLGIVWLVAILIIFLGCTCAYVYKLNLEIKELKSESQSIKKEEVNVEKINQEEKLSESEALKIGTQLFEKIDNSTVNLNKLTKKEIEDFKLTDNVVKEIKAIYEANKDVIDDVRFCTIFCTDDVGKKELKVSKLSENEIIFNVLFYTMKETEEQDEILDHTYINAFKIKKIDGNWLVDSIKE